MKYIILSLISCLTFFGCCRDTGDGCVSLYTFEVPLEVNYSDGAVSLGDTLTISMNTDNSMLVDLKDTGRIVNFPEFDPFMHFYLISLDSFPIVDGFDVHEIVVDAGNEAQVAEGSELSDFLIFTSIDKAKEKSKLGFKIIVKRRGIFALYAYNALSFIDDRDFIDFPDRCGGRCCSGISASVKFNTINGNFDILSESNKEIENRYWKDFQGGRNNTSPFYFKVE